MAREDEKHERERHQNEFDSAPGPHDRHDAGDHQSEKRDRRFVEEDDREVVPEAVLGVAAEEKGEVSDLVVDLHRAQPDPVERRGNADVREGSVGAAGIGVRDRVDGEEVAGPKSERGDDDRDRDGGEPARASQRLHARGEQCGRADRKEGDEGVLRQQPDPDRQSEEDRAGGVAPLEPAVEGDERERQRRGDGHVGGDEAGVSQDRRQRAEERDGEERRAARESPRRPPPHAPHRDQ